MGLDNGFVCKNIKRNEVPTWVKLPWERNDYCEIAYFRKYWGLRSEILAKLHCTEDNDSSTQVDAEDIIPLVKVIMQYLDEEYYEDNANSIWDFDEAKSNIQQSIINLIWLKSYMDTHPETECYFYDSY